METNRWYQQSPPAIRTVGGLPRCEILPEPSLLARQLPRGSDVVPFDYDLSSSHRDK